MQILNNTNQFQYQEKKQLSIGSAFKFSPAQDKSSNLNTSCVQSNCSSAASSNYDCESSQINDESFEEEAQTTLFEHSHHHSYNDVSAKNCNSRRLGSFEELQQQKSKKKTKLCKNFMNYGTCQYGNMCNYAHGEEELSKKITPNNFMTKLCTSFQTNGVCMYGERCQFLHSVYDLKTELTYSQSLREGARLTDQRNSEIHPESNAECLWANLKSGDGCGAPKKPRLQCFEQIYNKENLHENMRIISEEEGAAERCDKQQQRPI